MSRIEVLGRERSASIIDFRTTLLEGRRIGGQQDKGHFAEVRAFRSAVAGRGGAHNGENCERRPGVHRTGRKSPPTRAKAARVSIVRDVRFAYR